jgi:hypothetical protein
MINNYHRQKHPTTKIHTHNSKKIQQDKVRRNTLFSPTLKPNLLRTALVKSIVALFVTNLKLTITGRHRRHYTCISYITNATLSFTNLEPTTTRFQDCFYPSIDTPVRKKSTNKFHVEYVGDFCPALLGRFALGRDTAGRKDGVEGGGGCPSPSTSGKIL